MSVTTRRAVLSVAIDAWYPRGQHRLFESLEERHENSTRLFWHDELPPGCPPHTEAPYAFKPYAFQHARTLGFDQVIWLDASVWAHRKPLDDLWAQIDETGWYLEPDGNIVGEWINDRALNVLGITRDEAMSIPLFEGKVIGLDFRDETANRFLDEWVSLVEDGAFLGGWSNTDGLESQDPRCKGHRHDIACGSPVAVRLGMRYQTFKRLGFPSNGEPGDEICLLAEGM